MNEITKVLRENPDCFIYYHDNGSWTIYRNQNCLDEVGDIIGEEADVILYEGDDYSMSDGYAPSLVIALAELVGIEVDSI
jgi:hypothetical protein